MATKKTDKTTASAGFSDDEKAAMKERAAENKRAKTTKGAKAREANLQACVDKIASMPPADRVIAQKVHEIVTATAPDLDPKTWYGMPAYADADGKVVVFFKDAAKFKSRYCTLGFEEAAQLDDGDMWVTSYAVTGIGAKEEATITSLVKKAIS